MQKNIKTGYNGGGPRFLKAWFSFNDQRGVMSFETFPLLLYFYTFVMQLNQYKPSSVVNILSNTWSF